MLIPKQYFNFYFETLNKTMNSTSKSEELFIKG